MANMELKAIITAQDKASSVISGVGRAFTSLAKIGIAGAIAGVAGLGFVMKKSMDEFIEGQVGIAQTNAVLKSTGGIAGVTAEAIDEMNKKLSTTTMFSDDAVRSGQNMLLTFTKIGKDTFPEATQVMLDMSQALGQDVKSSAIQLGKALQDPILGVTALRRVGVNFGEAEETMIETMVKAGDTMGAQKFILKELQTEFGGSAVAAGQTFAGSLAIMKQKMDDVKESIGQALFTAIQPFVDKLSEWAANPEVQDKIVAIITLITQSFIVSVQWLTETIKILVAWFVEIKNKIVEFFTQTQLGQTILFTFQGLIQAIVDQAKRLWQIILDNKEMFIFFGKVIAAIAGVALALFLAALSVVIWTLGKVIEAFGFLYNKAKAVAGFLVLMFTEPMKAMKTFINFFIKGINSIITGFNRIPGVPNIPNIPFFKNGGTMQYDGLAYLHAGERVIPAGQTTNNNSSATVNFYGNINNTDNRSLDDIARRISSQINLARQGAM